jgi:hypothetical protein
MRGVRPRRDPTAHNRLQNVARTSQDVADVNFRIGIGWGATAGALGASEARRLR